MDDVGEKMTIEEFINSVNAGAFTDYDGYALAYNEKILYGKIILPSNIIIPDDATHIVWFNK